MAAELKHPQPDDLRHEPREDYEPASSDSSNNGAPIEKVPTKASINNVASIPNGGLKAWLQVAGSFFLMFNSWGVVNTFGVYQTYYESGALFTTSSSTISWIGAIQAFLLMLIGALTGPIYDAGHFRALLVTGTFLIVFGHMMLSLCHEFWQALLAQAFCVGLGCGCLFVPAVAIISTYFTTKLSFAVGIAASGSSLGGVIYPIVFYKLQPMIGFGWATRVIGFMALATLLFSILVMKMRVQPAAKRKLIDLTAFRELPYVTFVLGSVIGFAGLYVPFFYIQYFSIQTGITDENLGFYLLSILNSASIFGRILPNFLADKIGPINMLIPCSVASGVLCLCLIATHNLGGVVTIALLYGFFSGTFVSLPPSVFVRLTKNRAMIGTRMGMGFSITSLGVLAGTPIAGAILGSENDFTGIWAFGGALVLGCACLYAVTRMSQANWKLWVKV